MKRRIIHTHDRRHFRRPTPPIFASSAVVLLACFGISPSLAQDNDKPAEPPAAGTASANDLALEQSRVADKYAKLEQLMLKMAELEGANESQAGTAADAGRRTIERTADQAAAR